MSQNEVRLFGSYGPVIRRDAVAAILTDPIPPYPASYNNFYLIHRNGEEIGAKAVIYLLTRDEGHNTSHAVTALLRLGFHVNAKRRYESHERYREFLDIGLLTYDG